MSRNVETPHVVSDSSMNWPWGGTEHGNRESKRSTTPLELLVFDIPFVAPAHGYGWTLNLGGCHFRKNTWTRRNSSKPRPSGCRVAWTIRSLGSARKAMRPVGATQGRNGTRQGKAESERGIYTERQDARIKYLVPTPFRLISGLPAQMRGRDEFPCLRADGSGRWRPSPPRRSFHQR